MYVLTALAAVVVVLTRLRLGRRSGGAGRLNMGRGLVNVHTVAGVLALVSWVIFLVASDDVVPRQRELRHPLAGLLVGHRDRRPADPGAVAATARPARLAGGRRLVVRRPRALDPRARRHARGRLRLHLGLPHLCGLTPCASGPWRSRRTPRRRSLVAATPSYAAPAPVDRPAVIERVVIGHSVQGRPITAWHLGQPGKRRVLLISTMHGDEGKPRQILGALRDGRPIRGIDLWVVPVYNPDGLARGTRKNAHGVDLNRNFPYRWADLDGSYESGQRAGSEPETRAMMGFLRELKPVADHQLPPAAARRGHRHQERRVLPAGRRRAAPAAQVVHLRRRLPRHHDRLVQQPVRRARPSPSSTATGPRRATCARTHPSRCCGSSAPAGSSG